jgi:hypothetical protein
MDKPMMLFSFAVYFIEVVPLHTASSANGMPASGRQASAEIKGNSLFWQMKKLPLGVIFPPRLLTKPAAGCAPNVRHR